MSGFASGTVRTFSTDDTKRHVQDMSGLFSGSTSRKEYEDIISGKGLAPRMNVKCVKVHVFDLSDKAQVKKYEKLWKMLIEKSYTGKVIVESHRDLVRREDGTSYWMKYVEYVELSEEDER